MFDQQIIQLVVAGSHVLANLKPFGRPKHQRPKPAALGLELSNGSGATAQDGQKWEAMTNCLTPKPSPKTTRKQVFSDQDSSKTRRLLWINRLCNVKEEPCYMIFARKIKQAIRVLGIFYIHTHNVFLYQTVARYGWVGPGAGNDSSTIEAESNSGRCYRPGTEIFWSSLEVCLGVALPFWIFLVPFGNGYPKLMNHVFGKASKHQVELRDPSLGALGYQESF